MAVFLPDVVVHHHLPGRQPFANLSDLDGADLIAVVEDLTRRYRSGEIRRVFGPRYMDMRRRTEEKMRRLFVEAGEVLSDVIDRHGLPADQDDTDHAGYERRPFEKYIEVQLWSDAPIGHLLH